MMSERDFLTNINMNGNQFVLGGFEVVQSLPTNGLFLGRQIMYNKQPYWYNGNEWITFPVGLYWSLVQSNAENGTISVTIQSASDSIFPQISAQSVNKSRNIICENSASIINDLFGNLSTCLPNVRYDIYLHTSTECKIYFSKEIFCNIDRTDVTPYPSGFYMRAKDWAKIQFIKITDSDGSVQLIYADIECVSIAETYRQVAGSYTDTTAGETTSDTLNELENYLPSNGMFFFQTKYGGTLQPYLIANEALQPKLYSLITRQKDKDTTPVWQAKDKSNKVAMNLNDLFELILSNR